MSATIAVSMILKSLISAVCYCLCATYCEKECDTRECPRCHSDSADSHTFAVGSRANSPPPPCLELELLAPIFGFLLSMFFTICESLLNTSTLGLMYEDTLRYMLIGRDAENATVFPAYLSLHVATITRRWILLKMEQNGRSSFRKK